MPDDFAISDRVRSWAAKNGFDRLEQRFEHFVGKARANGYRYVDWDEGFMGAIREDWARLGPANQMKPDGRGLSNGNPQPPPPVEKSFTLAELGLDDQL